MADNRIRKLEDLDEQIQNLINEATKVRENAYCPYSKFKVGAAVLDNDNNIYTGCNIENGAYTVGLCAERCAYGKAISTTGKSKFEALAVVAQQENSFTMPCGACRQFLSEFGNVEIYLRKPTSNEVFISDLNEILPYQFDFSDLKQNNVEK